MPDVTINYTNDQIKQQMFAALSGRMSAMKFKKNISLDDVKLEVKVDNNFVPLEELKIVINIPE